MEISVYDLAVIPIITAFGQIIQKTGVKERYIPALEILIGILIGIFYLGNGDIKKGVFLGIWAGLAATGLLNGTKITVNGSFKNRNGNGSAKNDEH